MTNKEFFIKQWTSEIKATVNCINAVPDAKADYKPNPKNRSAHDLVSHLVGEAKDMVTMVEAGTIDHASATFTNMAEAATAYETASKKFLEKLAATDEQTWSTKMIPFN